MQAVQGSFCPRLGFGTPGFGTGQGEPVPFQIRGDNGQPGLGVVDGGLHLEQGRRLRRASGNREGGEHVPGPGHGCQVRVFGNQQPRTVQVFNNRHPGQKCGHCSGGRAPGGYQVHSPAGAGRQASARGGVFARHGRSRRQQQGGTPGVVILQELHHDGSHVRIPDHYRFGGLAQCCGNRRLVARPDREGRCQGAGDAVQSGVEGVRRAVLAVESKLQRIPACHQGVPFAGSVSRCGGQIGNFLDDGVELCAGVLVVGVKAFLPFLNTRHLRFQGGELRLGLAAAFLPCSE